MARVNVLGIVYILIGLLELIHGQNQAQTCPATNDISPCVCQVKKNGLDILCEATDVGHINKAMSTLKSRNPIIFYLKLRHNNLPKLQGFFFLSLDIRHLTVHNSSLAAIEETALSSLGTYPPKKFLLLAEAVGLTVLRGISRKGTYAVGRVTEPTLQHTNECGQEFTQPVNLQFEPQSDIGDP